MKLLILLLASVGIVTGFLVFARAPQRAAIILPVPFTPPPQALPPVRLLFGGDMMFDRSIRETITKKGESFVLAPLHDLLLSHDAVIANLEGPITPNDSKSLGSLIGSRDNYIFTFPLRTTAILQSEHIGIVNLGNNHSDDFGSDGIAETVAALDQSAIKHFGDVGVPNTARTLVTTINGLRIGFVNYNQFVAHGGEHVIEDLTAIRPLVDMVVVYTHWGTEYVTVSSPAIQTLGHSFIDNGADLVIGSHPHVVQQKELYHGKWIYYSLGNMIFDQYFEPETQAGLLVSVVIDPNTREIVATDIPIILRLTGQTTLKTTPLP